jgi:hypothetical protein
MLPVGGALFLTGSETMVYRRNGRVDSRKGNAGQGSRGFFCFVTGCRKLLNGTAAMMHSLSPLLSTRLIAASPWAILIFGAFTNRRVLLLG